MYGFGWPYYYYWITLIFIITRSSIIIVNHHKTKRLNHFTINNRTLAIAFNQFLQSVLSKNSMNRYLINGKFVKFT